ncbi:hypothetical protein [Streptomyces swartbergensis]|uniref:hypothetical protein n=1 Tax=Streptomyces swartbergensis TaxID=487165 RepID=UPI0038304359
MKAERGTSPRKRLRVPGGEPVDLSRHDAATPGGPDGTARARPPRPGSASSPPAFGNGCGRQHRGRPAPVLLVLQGDWAVGTLLLEHLRELDPRYPEAAFDVAECRKRLLRQS